MQQAHHAKESSFNGLYRLRLEQLKLFFGGKYPQNRWTCKIAAEDTDITCEQLGMAKNMEEILNNQPTYFVKP